MGLILADHEGQFEWSRQLPAFVVAAGVLLVIGAVLFRVVGRRPRGWLASPAGRVAVLAVAASVVAVVVGSWPIQPDTYWVCGPVFHEWTESPLCVDELRPFRQAVVALGAVVVALFTTSCVLDRRQAVSDAPPPGTRR